MKKTSATSKQMIDDGHEPRKHALEDRASTGQRVQGVARKSLVSLNYDQLHINDERRDGSAKALR